MYCGLRIENLRKCKIENKIFIIKERPGEALVSNNLCNIQILTFKNYII